MSISARVRSGLSAVTPVAACLAFAFWIYYAIQRQVAGPLNSDEIYFAHILWLIHAGKRQYVDFFSQHLPTYFQLLQPLVAALSKSPTDLNYVWGARAISALVIVSYLALAAWVHRRAAPEAGRAGLLATAASMLVFVVLARMVEVRSDTLGLLLMNAAWAIVLGGRTAVRAASGATLAGLAILFAPRAAGMAGILGLTLLVLALRARDGASVRGLLYVAGGFAAAAVGLYLAAPDWVALVVRSCFVEPVKFATAFPYFRRFLAGDRIPLVLLLALGAVGGLRLAHGSRREQGILVSAACIGQLLILCADPAPFEYVYGWAALPAVFGIVSMSRLVAVSVPFLFAMALVGLSASFILLNGHQPPTLSPLRLSFDATISREDVARLPTPALIALVVGDQGQQNLENQLRIRSELCRRVRGTVMASFGTNPLCLPDTLYVWSGGVRLPAIAVGDPQAPGSMTWPKFEAAFLRASPEVFIWADRWEPPHALLHRTRQMLACCYDVHDGFAIRRDEGRGSQAVP
ncbi:hypothetical protein JJB11_06850 [Ramlibacter ginsenosidimutans]|uniref:Uncharacterized protein n=1 Tax=Ramlibacter ginsenosidimutans TaxID=502333 RepID=A0A934WKJ9_9BURK|nr:hypothetical protein [Ramlibacter ginsenosidimutans]MBK6005809.1 hypothetical protein [Ramlibacter ginsenosidimutans]